MQLAPRVPASRDPLVDAGALITRAWFRFFQLLESSVEGAALQQYTVVQNSTGTTIPKGTAVGFVGVGSNNVLSVAPYLADGSTPTLFILGVLAEQIPDSGSTGLCCVWGEVSGIDTSAFNVGDILYASTTVAGAFTNVKPTAPNNVIPMAAVLIKSATAGVIFVRPTIEQESYYGEFTRTTNLSAAAINTAYAIALTNTEVAGGVVLTGSPTDRLQVPQSGLYQFSARFQLSSTSASSKNARFWYRLNGSTNLANSTAIVSVDANNGYATISVSEIVSLAANDYIQLMWAVSDTTLSLSAVAATGYSPGAASVWVSVTQIQQ